MPPERRGMDFWLLNAQSTREVGGEMVAFDYTNTFFSPEIAVEEAKILSLDNNVLCVSVHHWILKSDGTQEHAENGDKTDIPYSFINRNHWELKERGDD